MHTSGRQTNSGGEPASRGDSPTPHVGRFRLDDLIHGDERAGLWLGWDTVLRRRVSLRIIAPDDPHQEAMRNAACSAARATDQELVRVIDVIDDDNTVVIVSEWIDGHTLDQAITEPVDVESALATASSVADAVFRLHCAGLNHGHIDPECVIVADEGPARLRGHMVRAARRGTYPGHDPDRADLAGIGAVLMGCLTAHWPGTHHGQFPPTPQFGRRTARADQLKADIPPEVSEFIDRCLASAASMRTSPSAVPFDDIVDLRAALAQLVLDFGSPIPAIGAHPAAPTGPNLGSDVSSSGNGRKVFVGVIAATLLLGLGSLTAAATLGGPETRVAAGPSIPPSEAPVPDGEPVEPRAEIRDTLDVAVMEDQPIESVLPIRSAAVFDPAGRHLDERPAENAIDNDVTTAWLTTELPQPQFPSRQGEGILIDLGQTRAITAVNLRLVGNLTSFQVLAGHRPSEKLGHFQRIARYEYAPASTVIRKAQPTHARYLVVYLEELPWDSSAYRGGIASLEVLGS